MIEKIKQLALPHCIGFCFIVVGWYISILNVGLTRFQTNVLFTRWTFAGLLFIIIGAYIPEVWKWIRNKKS